MKLSLNTSFLPILLCLISGFALAANNFHTTARGAQFKDLKTGTGEIAELGDVATIHFVSWLGNNGAQGKEFYNTRAHGKSVSFVVGSDKVMPGWNEGVVGMKQGGKRMLILPPALGYGSKGIQGAIPPNTSLIFVIELVQLKK